jgi:Thrombospondin C-terminal region/von Willebrand factor type A domain
MPAEIPTTPPPKGNRRRRLALYVGGSVVVALVLVLLLFNKKKEDAPQPAPPVDQASKPLFVPRELAAHESLDRDGVLAYCRKLKPAAYPGILRGAHGALWASEANRWDRVLLATEALQGMGVEARIVPGEHPRLTYQDGDKWHTLRLDAEDPPQTTSQPPPGAVTAAELATQAPARFQTIRPVLILEKDGRPQRVEAGWQQVAEWVHQPVLLSAIEAANGLEYVLHVGTREVLRSGALAGVRRASLELIWQAADHPSTWVRELFDADNANAKNPGHDAVRKGDRYAIVLAAGPINLRVLETRLRMVAANGPTPVEDETARLLLGHCVKYQVDCDDRTQALAEETKVAVAWNEPRITIAASEVPAKGEPGLSLDALSDAVEANGQRSREFHVARGMVNDIIETRVVFEARRKPVISASTVFSNFKASSPDAPARRHAIIEAEARRLLAHEPIGSTVKLEAMPPLAPSDDPATTAPDCPPLWIERTREGVALRGLRTQKEEEHKPWTKYDWDGSASAPFGNRTTELASVADAMMCRTIRRVDHVLKCTATSAWPLDSLPVIAGSFLEYTARDGEKEQRFGVRVGLNDGLPTDGKNPLGGDWPKVRSAGNSGALLAPPDVLAKGEALKIKVRVGENLREVAARKVTLPDSTSATLLDSPGFPLVLAWERGKDSLTLASASPVVQGRVLDRETGEPAPATVSLARSARKTTVVRKPMDLSTWKAQGLDDNHKWQLAADGRSVVHASNGSPTFFVSPNDMIDVTLRGTIEVLEYDDDDHVGLVLGYRSPIAEKGHKNSAGEMLLFAWKRAEQTTAAEGLAPEGFTLARLKGTFTGSGDAYPALWQLTKRPGVEPLATKYGEGTGWRPKVEHTFEVTYRKDSVRVVIDDQEIFKVKGSFAPGRFGFYNYSQPNVRYRLFSPHEEVVEAAAETSVARPVAADGSFALPAAPLVPRLILILDRSGSMAWGMDPKAKERNPMLGPDKKCRMDYLKKEVHGLLDKLPPGVEVAMWSFSWTPRTGGPRHDADNPAHTREDCPFTTDLSQVRHKVDALKPEDGTPLTGAVVKLLDHVKSDPLSRDAIAILLTDGQNDDDHPSPVEAYKARQGKAVIHTIGFAIAPGGKEEKEMRELARMSGGLYRLAGSSEDLKLAFDTFRSNLLDVRLAVTSSCHAGEERAVTSADLGRGKQDFALTHGCSTCRCLGKTFLTVTKETAGRLKECEGLTPKGRRLIEERVADGAWRVTVPTARVNIGPASAYAWFETEKATGRVVGRTEDGLHGSIADASFPDNVYRAGHDFITWYQGVVSYTSGSVEAGLRWHRQPGFPNSTPEDFKRFVQANALAYSARWWSEFGDAAFPESVSAYWAGVCLNFTLQSMAFQVPSTDCFRQWGRALCKQLGDKIKGLPGGWLDDQVGKMIDDEFGPELREYTDKVKTWYERVNRSGAGDKEKGEAKDFLGKAQKWAQDILDHKVDGLLDCDNRFGLGAGTSAQ